jgi:ketosteroid isomerase-like protein
VTDNKATVERYMEGFRRNDHAAILACLTDDVEWLIPGAFHVSGKPAFDAHIEDEECFIGPPEIAVSRLVEERDVVVAEGSVRTRRTDGTPVSLVFCDVFEMTAGKIRRLISYLVQTG